MTPWRLRNPARLTMATAMALALHGATAWGLLNLSQAPYTPPIPNAGFEVVDLSAFGVAAVVEPELKPEPKLEPEPEPEPEPKPKPVKEEPVEKAALAPEPIFESKPEPQVVERLEPAPPPPKPAPQTKPRQQIPVASGSQNAFVPPSSHAAYLRNPKPSYPAMAQRRGMEGVVLVFVEVSAQGMPKTVTVKKSSGFLLLDKAALRAVRAWRFAPATRGGQPVAAEVEVPIRFTLNDA